MKYAVHDILKCKMPEFAVIDSSEKGFILAGIPKDLDKRAAKLLGLEGKNIDYLKLVEESFLEEQIKEKTVETIPNVVNQ